MNSIAQSDNHVPCGYMGMLGCNGYEQTGDIICLIANGDNNFLNEGIVEGSILFIDTKSKFQQRLLNVFKFKSNISPQYKLSRNKSQEQLSVGKCLWQSTNIDRRTRQWKIVEKYM